MKRLFFVVVALAVLYAGYWVVGSRTVETQAEAALDGLRAEGWDVSYSRLNTSGFPSRFDTTLSDPDLMSPTGVRYTAPFLQVFALSYRPNEVIVIFPPEQRVQIAGSEITVATDRLRASASVAASTSLPFRTATVEGGATTVAFGDGLAATVDSVLLALRRATPDGADYDAFADLRGIVPPAPDGTLPGPVERAMLDALISLDAPLDREGFAGGAAPQITAIEIKEALVVWDDMQMRASGTLGVDRAGFAEGEIEVRLRDWDRMLTIASQTGLMDAAVAATYREMADTLAEGADEVILPLTFSGGAIRMGFVPLGAAPRLR